MAAFAPLSTAGSSSSSGVFPPMKLDDTSPAAVGADGEPDIKNKNVRQTSLFVDLHEAIEEIGKHFLNHHPDMVITMSPDYAAELRDEVGCDPSQPYPRQKLRRAKALIDFKKHDPDELGFNKNDIITIISEKDEHCWVGQLNGQRGWFPAKFVEVLNETQGEYSIAGDDRVTPYINDLVRGKFCKALKRLMTYGMKRTLFQSLHPWMVIENVASASVESDFNSVYSRLVLTRTFRLDELARVLSPSEMLYRTVSHINHTHENEPMDVKFRSLCCAGLNYQILHDWLTVICDTHPPLLAKYYYNWSFITSPAWKIMRAELR